MWVTLVKTRVTWKNESTPPVFFRRTRRNRREGMRVSKGKEGGETMIRVRLLVMVASKHETRSPSETNYRAAAPHLVFAFGHWATLHLASQSDQSVLAFGFG